MKHAITISTINAYGWKVYYQKTLAGNKIHALILKNTTRQSLGRHTLYTKGLVVGTNLSTGEQLPSREAGTLTSLFPDPKAGRLEFIVAKDTEWWCIDSKVNKGLLPSITTRNLLPGETATGNLLVCTENGILSNNYIAEKEVYVICFENIYPQ